MAKRSLGQNFLTSGYLAERIVDFAGVAAGEYVLEIGPGRGMLTRVLLQRGCRVVAVEKDDDLAARLQQAYVGHDDLTIVHGDILAQDVGALVPPASRLVANLPYNIATRILLGLSPWATHLASLTVMVQKEVGQRICAQPGETAYAALSVILAAAFEAHTGFIIGPQHFRPRPKIDSMVVGLTPAMLAVPPSERSDFETVVYRAFAGRRKMLRNTLLQLPGLDPADLGQVAQRSKIDLQRRPQELGCAEFLALSRACRELGALPAGQDDTAPGGA